MIGTMQDNLLMDVCFYYLSGLSPAIIVGFGRWASFVFLYDLARLYIEKLSRGSWFFAI